jgi:hypothetical protein
VNRKMFDPRPSVIAFTISSFFSTQAGVLVTVVTRKFGVPSRAYSPLSILDGWYDQVLPSIMPAPTER